MGIPNSFAHIFNDIDKLLGAIDANAQQIAGLAEAKAELERTFGVLKDLSVRRDTLKADKQVLSQELILALKDAKERRSELRSFLRFKLGMRNEKLVEFRVPPQRAGQKRAKKAAGAAKAPSPTPASPAPPAPAPVPAASVAPDAGATKNG